MSVSAAACRRSEHLWQGLDWVVDMDSRRELLELVATAVVATIKLHPRWYAGSYRVWLGEPVAPWKLKISVYFNYNDRGARTPRVRSVLTLQRRVFIDLRS